MQQPQKTPVKTGHAISFAKISGWAMLGLGTAALIFATVFVSQILAIIGLGLIFWGAVLIYIRTDEYVKENLLDVMFAPSLSTLNQVISELGYKGIAIYLPPKYFTEPEASKAYISKQEGEILPSPEQIQQKETQILIENPPGILLTPPGAELMKLLEKMAGTTFTKIDLPYLQQNMPKLFVEDLEIAQNFDIKTEKNKVYIKMESSIYKNMNRGNISLSRTRGDLGCPISSAIASALAKATGKPIIIEDQQTSKDGKNINIEFSILEQEKTQQ